MPASLDVAAPSPSDQTNRNLAFLGYGLLFAAPFFAGLPALIAVAIAYGRQSGADGVAPGHFRFQILIFWIAFALIVLAMLSGAAVLLVAVGQLVRIAIDGRWDGFDTALFSEPHVGAALIGVVLACGFAVLSVLWLLGASAYGVIRLASGQSIGQTAR